jgi:hypothetical protein
MGLLNLTDAINQLLEGGEQPITMTKQVVAGSPGSEPVC